MAAANAGQREAYMARQGLNANQVYSFTFRKCKLPP